MRTLQKRISYAPREGLVSLKDKVINPLVHHRDASYRGPHIYLNNNAALKSLLTFDNAYRARRFTYVS